MKIKSIGWIFILVLLGAFIAKDNFTYRHIDQKALRRGEKMEYRVHYGMINAAEGIMQIDNRVHWMNRRPCYKVDVYGNTTGFFDMMLRVRDNWGSYIDTSAIVPQRAYRFIQEGKYKKKEITDFYHKEKTAEVHRLDKHTGKLLKKEKFKVPSNVQDIVSGYYYLRTIDLDTIANGKVFNVKGFFDDTLYNMKVKMVGREKLKTKIGEFNTVVLSPIMPENSLFSGRNPIRAWLSDDKRKIPLKVKAQLVIGALEIDIKDYKSGK